MNKNITSPILHTPQNICFLIPKQNVKITFNDQKETLADNQEF